eukprot:TRINITY_DN8951_c0_g1_i2.p1 TRINITY_DN8951_c0_g1~~TRINITY_DN8951_c0_g1_i2.p1  ORF type:complete len:730 (-),score=93.69 TRINITY_DN8951_c0_g1_i2:13-2202(-)
MALLDLARSSAESEVSNADPALPCDASGDVESSGLGFLLDVVASADAPTEGDASSSLVALAEPAVAEEVDQQESPPDNRKIRCHRFTAKLDRSEGLRLGIDVETGREAQGWDGKSLLVQRIQAEGLVPAWNASFPASAILGGDRIVEVNNNHGDADALLRECMKRTQLELVIERRVVVEEPLPQSVGAGAVVEQAEAIEAAISGTGVWWSNGVTDCVVRELRRDILSAKSATAVVQIVRRELARRGALQWAAQALYRIYRKSTALTRREWIQDKSVMELADRLKRQVSALVASSGSSLERSSSEELEEILVAMEALRRLGFHEEKDQKSALTYLVKHFESCSWQGLSAGALARTLWLVAPLRLGSAVQSALRALREGKRCKELERQDVAVLVDAMRRAVTDEFQGVAQRCRQNRILSLNPSFSLGSGLHASETFRLSFDVIPHGAIDEPTTLLRVECFCDDASRPGDSAAANALSNRLPVFYFVPGTTRLLCALGPHGQVKSKYYSPEEGLPVGQPSRVTFRMGPMSYSVTINGEEGPAQPLPQAAVGTRDLTAGASSTRFRIWACDAHYPAADASIAWLSYMPVPETEGRDEVAVLQKLAVLLREANAYTELSASELASLAEGLDDLEVRDVGALRALGQELLSRRRELTPTEVQRVHIAFQQCRLPLSKIWEAVGAKRKRRNHEIHTVQVFAPESGHGERGTKRAREHEVERVSPPRKSWDPIKASF